VIEALTLNKEIEDIESKASDNGLSSETRKRLQKEASDLRRKATL
jgi:hypothetical protein